MLFWLFVIILGAGIISTIVGKILYDYKKYDTEWLRILGVGIIIVAITAIVICVGIMIETYGTADANVASNQERYKSLTYQLENNLYDNDNDIGKKALYDEIREWNEDLAYYRAKQDNFWFGIFYPDIFDQFEFIPLE